MNKDNDDIASEIPTEMCCDAVIVCECNVRTCRCSCCPFCDGYTDTFSDDERAEY
jgi:hypothetical protein